MNKTTVNTRDFGWRLENSYSALPPTFYSRVRPAAVRDPALVLFNRPLAEELGLDPDSLDSSEGAAFFAGNAQPEGSDPIAQAYAGHQYGHFTNLGDGRAALLGEQISPAGRRFDVQLKGSGPTPYSRRGDGRAALGPMLREYIISEAMHALGIPTTRSLAVVKTGEGVIRETVLPGSVLTRVAASHIRVGTFQWAAAQGDNAGLQALADYTIHRHYPEIADSAGRYLQFLKAAIERQASLIAKWQLVGFIHGVMNTDNMALSGETIDYGPCAFMDSYDPATVFSSIDRHGRYAYGNQPRIAQWNLARFAETLLPLLDADQAKAVEQANDALQAFDSSFQRYWLDGMRAKLGLFNEEPDDHALAAPLLDWQKSLQIDFTNAFRLLSAEVAQSQPPFSDPDFREWHERWKSRLARQPESSFEVATRMQASNPVVIPRNHRVEEALEAAVTEGDLAPTRRLISVLASPFDPSNCEEVYTQPPKPGERVFQTFCGT